MDTVVFSSSLVLLPEASINCAYSRQKEAVVAYLTEHNVGRENCPVPPS